MEFNRLIILIGISLLLLGCGEEPIESKSKFVEFVKLKGTCFEDHVQQEEAYTGNLVHWYNETKDRHSRYGSVHLAKALSPKRMLEKIQNPNEYYPPFSITFWQVPPEMFSIDKMILEGVSEHLPKGNEEEGLSYKATCHLKVVKRLDYLPAVRDR